MKQAKINEYINELSYLTDLNTCIYFDGYGCSKYHKPCSGKKDQSNTPCMNKDYKNIKDKLDEKADKT